MASIPIYEPLDSERGSVVLRVVVLLPGPRHSPIVCRLKTVDFAEGFPSYDALSYEWGDSKGSKWQISLQGQSFMIGLNLWLALNYLRSEKRSQTLWIDAICINQEDTKERNHQVRLMRTVFSRARKVRVWLGREGLQSGNAFDLMKGIFGASRGLTFDALKNNKCSADQHSHMDHFCCELETPAIFGDQSNDESANDIYNASWDTKARFYTNEDAWEALLVLLSRSYWSRIWIVQEFILGKKLIFHCGYDSMDESTFLIALTHIMQFDVESNSDIPIIIRHSVDKIRTSKGVAIWKSRVRGERRTLLELLAVCKTSKCLDPRDKVYALLGLASDVPDGAIIIDYSRALSKVKMDVVWFFQFSDNTWVDRRSQICSLLDESLGDDAPVDDFHDESNLRSVTSDSQWVSMIQSKKRVEEIIKEEKVEKVRKEKDEWEKIRILKAYELGEKYFTANAHPGRNLNWVTMKIYISERLKARKSCLHRAGETGDVVIQVVLPEEDEGDIAAIQLQSLKA